MVRFVAILETGLGRLFDTEEMEVSEPSRRETGRKRRRTSNSMSLKMKRRCKRGRK